MKKILCLLFALMLMLSLCACGGNNADPTDAPTDPTGDPNPSNPTDPTDPTDDGLTEYVITVQDEAGNPIVGVYVQICKDGGCMPCDDATDENGKASKRAEQDNYKAQISRMPEGYVNGDAADADGYYYFASGATEITITLKAAA